LQDDSDPLVFLESIPNDETRRFIHQVLADSWIYAEEIGLRPASLDDLAQGNFPLLRNVPAVAAAN
jgi:soluble lytic murein transglycosylase-like protein